MSDSRLAGLRKGVENASALRLMQTRIRENLEWQGRHLSNATVQGRLEIFEHRQARERVDSMSQDIRKVLSGLVTEQELRDAKFLLENAARWER